MISQAQLKKLLHYDPDTGIFIWLTRRGGQAKAGVKAGNSSPGYTRIVINNRHYKASRLAWLYMTGSWPKECIDHIDRDRLNDRFNNLREANYSQNARNSSSKLPASGIRGAFLNKRTGVYYSSITIDGKREFIGTYSTAKEAGLAYKKRALEIDTEFYKGILGEI